MAKQDDFVRTQVRLDTMVYDLLKAYCQKHDMSMNRAINSIILETVLDEAHIEDTQENKEQYVLAIHHALQSMTAKEMRDISSLLFMISHLKKGN